MLQAVCPQRIFEAEGIILKLPWDRNYLKISFHVIVTLIAIYAVSLVLKNAPEVIMTIEKFLEYMAGIFSPLIIAAVFSYIVSPAVDLLQGFFDKMSKKEKICRRDGKRVFKKRTAGTAALYLIIFGGLAVLAFFVINGIGEADMGYVERKIRSSITGFMYTLKSLNVRLAESDLVKSETGIYDAVTGFLRDTADKITTAFASRASQAGRFGLDLLIGLTAAFYFLAERDKILYYGREFIRTFMPAHSEDILNSLCEADRVFSGYISGQITDAFIMAALVSAAFLIIGIDYPLIIGIVSGFSNLIPYIGAIAAFFLGTGVALISGSPVKALYAAVVIILLQQLDSAVIVPKLVGNKVKLHPVLVILSLSIFGSIFGIWGMVFAVPVTAIIKIIFARIYNAKKNRLSKNLEI